MPHTDRIHQTRLLIVRQFAEQVLRLREEIEIIETTLRQRLQESATPLVQVCGVGTLVRARLLGELGCTPRLQESRPLCSRREGGTGIDSIAGATGN